MASACDDRIVQKDMRLLRSARGKESLTAAPPAKVRHHLFFFCPFLLARGTWSGATVTMVQVAFSDSSLLSHKRERVPEAVEINKS